ncbi:MAG: NAD(P)/FAD-dependent oxidoreductase [Bacillota bacterium]
MRNVDIAIIGCGPAGLSAAINATIRNKSIALLGGETCSHKMAVTPRVDNFLGFSEIKGDELRQKFIRHAEQMGVSIERTRVDAIYPMGESGFTIVSKTGEVTAKAVILALGVTVANYLPNEQKFLGRGVSYCATCDGPLYRGKTVAIVAYTKEAEEEARFLAEIAREVIYIPLYKDLGQLPETVRIINQKPKAIRGETIATHLQVGEEWLGTEGIFVLREVTPVEQLVPGLEIENRVIKVNRDLETNIPGVFAAGDCTGKPYQLMKAAGEGQVAALNAVRYLDSLIPDWIEPKDEKKG